MGRWQLTTWSILTWATIASAETTYRLQDGITAFVPNPQGKEFTVSLAVRDLNIYEAGPREILCKIYDPDGKAVVRQVIPDDGVTSQAFMPPMGAWDHEAWYYAFNYMKGTQPMIRWSAFSAPDRLKSLPKRTFTFKAGGKPGVYRLLLVGITDHYVTVQIDPELPYAVAGHPDWLHVQGQQWQNGFVYVPRGTKGLHVLLAEYDLPRSRKVKVTAPDGKVLFDGVASGAYTKESLDFAVPYDDQLLKVEVAPGPGDVLLGLKLRFAKDPEVTQRGERVVTAALASDEATARAARNGAIYHDERVFWHPIQVRLHDWLKKLPADAFEVKDENGKPAEPVPGVSKGKLATLPTRPGFIPLNGPHWAPTLCDRILHHYPAHKNRAALNLAIKDLIAGVRSIGPNDHVAVAVGGPFANMAYEYSNYAWHYWRAAWRLIKETDAPEDLKALVHEAFLIAGDRLAFCRTWERVNGNSFALILTALRYCCEATGDPLQKDLFETYWQRFANGGWGERVGVGPSGPVQEGFAYAYHYASYILASWQSILADLPDERFQKVYDRVRIWFSYTLNEERIPAGPWSSRTHYYPQWNAETEGPFAWKGLPGPDFTVSVNDAQEWFAARRKNYYVLTYHGRLSPKWESNAHAGQTGYGGGMLCQLHIPGRGTVLASTLNGAYGEGMDTSLWRTFHLHTTVGQFADGTPFVSGDSEHTNARLDGLLVTSSGDVRGTPLQVARGYTFGGDGITCTLGIKETSYADLLNLWVKNPARGKLAEAYEMIPYVAKQKPQPKIKAGDTVVSLFDGEKMLGPLTKEPTLASSVVIDRGGFGVRVILDQPRHVLVGANSTVLIRLVDPAAPTKEVALSYRLVPFDR
jgi:hypothetical protein